MSQKERSLIFKMSAILLGLLIIGLIIAARKSVTGSASELRLSSNAQKSPYLGEPTFEAEQQLGTPSYQHRANEPNPYGIESLTYILQNNGSIQLMASNGKIVCINTFDSQQNLIHQDMDKTWFKGFNAEQRSRDFNR